MSASIRLAASRASSAVTVLNMCSVGSSRSSRSSTASTASTGDSSRAAMVRASPVASIRQISTPVLIPPPRGAVGGRAPSWLADRAHGSASRVIFGGWALSAAVVRAG
jgi:hypothetical protein